MGVELPVESLRAVQPGDHIKFKRRPGYDHHAIVEEVDYEQKLIHVIEYGSDKGGSSFGKSVVHRAVVRGIRNMYKYVYAKCLDVATVIQKAVERLKERKYSLGENNCEHFATWCKTGVATCSQIAPAKVRATIAGVGGVIAGAVVRKAVVAGAEMARGVGGNVAKKVVAARRHVWKNGLKRVCKVGVRFWSVGMEMCLFGYSCYTAQRKYKEARAVGDKHSTEQGLARERSKAIIKAGFEAVGGCIGSTAGSVASGGFLLGIAGSFPPVVGTVIATAVSSVASRVIGRVFGSFFG